MGGTYEPAICDMQGGRFADEVVGYQVWARSSVIDLINKRDRKFSDEYFGWRDFAEEENNGKFSLNRGRSKIVVSPDFEIKSKYNIRLGEQDLDGDGFIDASFAYQVYAKGESIKLRSRKGNTFSDESNSRWNAIKAVAAGNGYKILLEGTSSRSGQFKIWKVNAKGIIQSRGKWKSIAQAMSRKWESIFGDVIQPDGIIGEPPISPGPPDQEPLFNEQWYLKSAADQGANVQQAWSQTTESGEPIYGAGVLIAIVDDGLQHDHEDLKANYDPSASYDFNFKDNDPYPFDTYTDGHGTSAAGVAAGVGFNGIGITGAAPDASLSGLRLIAKPVSEKKEARAFVYSLDTVDIYSNSWGPPAWEGIYPLSPLVSSAFETGITRGRDGKGAIYIWAGGNDRIKKDNSNYDGYVNSRYGIAVAAVSSNGIHADYSEPGANILISAPSDGGWHKPESDLYLESPPGLVGITTTDLSGLAGYNQGSGSLNRNKVANLFDENYTNDFGGTSSAAPLTSGIVALMLQANSNLSWRDVQHVLVNTASLVDSNSSGWITNGAGHYFNHDYGFGRIDADAAVALSKSWSNVAEEVTYSGSDSPGLIIPDKGGSSLTRTISIPQDINIETIEIPLIVEHRRRNHLNITLQSPAGTIATLAESRAKLVFSSNADYDFTFSAKTFWDESSKGDWTLTVTDRKKGRIGNLEAWGLNIFGTPGINYEQTLNSTSSIIKRDPITGGVGEIYATSEALDSIPGLASYLNYLDDRYRHKELLNASSWIVGVTPGSKLKRNGERFATSAKLDEIGGIADGKYQIYEINSNDFIIDQDIRKSRGSWIGRLDDQLAFAYPLVERQMSSRAALPDLKTQTFV